MRYEMRWTALLLLAALPAFAADKAGKNKGDKGTTPSDNDYSALAKAKEVEGVILKVEGTDKNLTFQYRYQDFVPNQKAINNANKSLTRQQQSILRQYRNALRTKNPYLRMQRLESLAIQMQNMGLKGGGKLYDVKNRRMDFELKAVEEVKVRVKKPPVEYDDKGNVKEYTKKELKELKGKDSKLPGYTASWENVSVGQTVKIHLKAKKKAKKDKDKDKKKKDKDEDKDKDDVQLDDDDKPVVTMIVIVKEPDSDKRPMKEKKRKNKE